MRDTTPTVICIPAKPEVVLASKHQLRVAAYCRVSTDDEEQLTSYEAQKNYYTDKIMTNKEWTMAGIFADEGITGTSARKRPEFLRMIRQCKQGKIDIVLTKSISRFARNTVDCLNYVRALKELGIAVIFEKENMNTLEIDSEILITMLGAFAQSESESISANVRWGIRQAMKEGKATIFQTSKANKIHTITYEEALNRVMSICDVDISNGLEKKLRDLNTVRNTLTHAEVVIEDSFIDCVFDGLLLELDVLFLKAIGSAYSNYYGFNEIKANYNSYMQYLTENKMLIKQKTFNALCIAQEKTEQYSGQNEVIYVEDITVVKKFMVALQEELDFGMDMYNRWCSGKTKVKVLDDGHISFWANDNRGEYIIKLKSMIVCVPKATSNESPIVIFESDKDIVEQDKQKYIPENNPDYLEGLVFPTKSSEPDIVYDPREIYEYQMRWTYDEDVVIPEYYQIVRFLEQRIFCCLNIQGLSYWDFNNFLRQSEKMTGSELADVLKEILAKRK